MNEFIDSMLENPKLYGFSIGISITILFYLFKDIKLSFSIPSRKESSYKCERAGRDKTSEY